MIKIIFRLLSLLFIVLPRISLAATWPCWLKAKPASIASFLFSRNWVWWSIVLDILITAIIIVTSIIIILSIAKKIQSESFGDELVKYIKFNLLLIIVAFVYYYWYGLIWECWFDFQTLFGGVNEINK